MGSSARNLLNENLQRIPTGRFAVHTHLKHFALITYSVPIERLTPWIPQEIFEIDTFRIGGVDRGLISVVPFLDHDFHFPQALPWAKFSFAQTNHRVYVRDKKTGRRAVWFFGTSLGSRWVSIPQVFWKLPWHYGKYRVDCQYNAQKGIYERYKVETVSPWCSASIDLEDSGEPPNVLEGFQTLDEMKLTLTHPVDGFYYRRDGKLGGYSIWHEEMEFTLARPKKLFFSLYEDRNILSRDEMRKPHSVLICPSSKFIIQVPPKRLRSGPFSP